MASITKPARVAELLQSIDSYTGTYQVKAALRLAPLLEMVTIMAVCGKLLRFSGIYHQNFVVFLFAPVQPCLIYFSPILPTLFIYARHYDMGSTTL